MIERAFDVHPKVIPEVLTTRKQWVTWRLEGPDLDKKIPYNPATGVSKAQTNNAATWGTFGQALQLWRRGLGGPGFVFTKDDPFVGIDLDGCRDPNSGEIADWALEIIRELNTYAEISPSGTGVKLWAIGKSPLPTGKKKPLPNMPSASGKDPAIEVYDFGRYFAVTGFLVEGCPGEPQQRQAQIESLVSKFWPRAGNQKTVAPKTDNTGQRTAAPIIERARKYIEKMPAAISGQDGSGRAFAVACALCIGFNLCREDALTLFREYNARCEPPWTEGELVHKIDDALAREGERGYLLVSERPKQKLKPRRHDGDRGGQHVQSGGSPERPEPISNFRIVELPDDEGAQDDSDEEKEKSTRKVTVPVPMGEIIDTINARMDGWPRRVDNMLFVDDPAHGVDYFDRRTTAGLFGWLRRHNEVHWGKGGNLVSQAELFAEIERTAKRYEAIELLPHEPPVTGLYYRGATPAPGDGSHIRELLDRFRPETTIDRDLIQAAMMTASWGGPAGCRPAFVITSDDGRGVGKSKVAETIGYLFGGLIDVSTGEDIEQLKTRMLTPGARTKRIALLDNIKTMRLSWAELEAMITSPIISGRQLYVGEGQRPNLLTWFLTLNGVSMATDMAQRSVIIKIVRGKNDGPWWEETRRFVDEHRQQILGDLVAALRAEPYQLREYTRWATWEQHVLSRLPEPTEAQRLILERQGIANCELDEAEIIEDHFADQLRRLGYAPSTAQVRIPVGTAAKWFGMATGEQARTAAVSKRLNQMHREGQIKRISLDPSRTYGRCFIWTGGEADIVGQPISNDLGYRISQQETAR